MKTKTTSMYSTAAAWGHAALPASCPRSLADLSEIAQIRFIDRLIVTTTHETSKSYSPIRELHQESFTGREGMVSFQK